MRSLSPAAAAAIASDLFGLVTFIKFEFASGTTYLNQSGWDLVWDGHTWLGTYGLTDISPVEASIEEARPLSFSLSGVPATSVPLAMNSAEWKGAPVTVYTAIVGTTGALTVHDVRADWLGRLSTLDVQVDAETASLAAQAEPLCVDLYRPRVARYTNNEQQRLHPGDRGLEYMLDQADKPIVWPAASYWKK